MPFFIQAWKVCLRRKLESRAGLGNCAENLLFSGVTDPLRGKGRIKKCGPRGTLIEDEISAEMLYNS